MGSKIPTQPFPGTGCSRCRRAGFHKRHPLGCFRKQTCFGMLKKGKVVIEHLLPNSLREHVQITRMMLMHKFQSTDVKKITVDIPKWLQLSLCWAASSCQVRWQAPADKAPKFQVLAPICWFVAAGSYWGRSTTKLPRLQLILSPQDSLFFSVWGTAMGNAQPGYKVSLFFPKSKSLSTKQKKLTQTPGRSAAFWPGLSKTHVSSKTSPCKGSSHQRRFVTRVIVK